MNVACPAVPAPDRLPLDPARLRRIPPHFAWIDHRLRERLHELTLEEIALLLFLHIAADRNGCSFWSDASIAKKLALLPGEVALARQQLGEKGFLLYRFPLYQLLSLS